LCKKLWFIFEAALIIFSSSFEKPEGRFVRSGFIFSKIQTKIEKIINFVVKDSYFVKAEVRQEAMLQNFAFAGFFWGLFLRIFVIHPNSF